MNTAALLALIGDLYAQVAQLRQENDELRKRSDTTDRPVSP